MGTSAWHLQQKQQRIKREIAQNLDFLVGSVSSQGASGGFNLTTKEKAKTKSKYIRVGMVEEVRRMTRRHQKLKALLKELAEVNWELLNLDNHS